MTDNLMRFILGMTSLVGFFAFVYRILTQPIPTDSKDLVNQAMIFGTGVISLIVGYFFGSSSGSKTKDKAISDSISNNKPKEQP